MLFGGVGRNEHGKLKASKHVQLLKMNTLQWRTDHTALLLPIGEAIYPAVRDLKANTVHIVTGGDESVHVIYDLRQEFLQRPVPELTAFDAFNQFARGHSKDSDLTRASNSRSKQS